MHNFLKIYVLIYSFMVYFNFWQVADGWIGHNYDSLFHTDERKMSHNLSIPRACSPTTFTPNNQYPLQINVLNEYNHAEM